MRLITWNCSRGRVTEKLERLMTKNPDVVVLQEASRLDKTDREALWWGKNPRTGLAVLARNGYELAAQRVPARAPWSIRAVTVTGPKKFHLLAVWTRLESGYLEGLAIALDHYKRFLLAAPSVVIGDFNASAQWDNPKRPIDFTRIARRLGDEFDLKSAYHSHSGEAFGAEKKATHYFWWQKERPFHIDYCFVPKAWRVTGTSVDTYRNGAGVSDHRPLIVDVAVRPGS